MGLFIFGAGGFGREVLCLVRDADRFWQHDSHPVFVVDDGYDVPDLGVPAVALSRWSPAPDDEVVVAVGNPAARRQIVAKLPIGTRFATLTHPTAVISDSVTLGPGSIVAAGCILTCDIRIGAHAHLNLHTTIGHDCVIGDYFTTAPAANVSGNCQIGDGVYIGTGAGIREGIHIASNVVIGMGAALIKNAAAPGTYVGIPARPI